MEEPGTPTQESQLKQETSVEETQVEEIKEEPSETIVKKEDDDTKAESLNKEEGGVDELSLTKNDDPDNNQSKITDPPVEAIQIIDAKESTPDDVPRVESPKSAKKENEPGKLTLPQSSATTSAEVSPQPSPAKDKPSENIPDSDQQTKKSSKGKTVWMSLDELVKWEKKIMSLDTKLKKSETELQTLLSRKSAYVEQLSTLASKQAADRISLQAAESKSKINVDALEQKNKTLVDMLDQADRGLQQNAASKAKELDISRETLSKLVRQKAADVELLQERYRKEHLVDSELNRLRTELDDAKKEMEKLDASIVQLRRKELEEKRRKEMEAAEQKTRDSLKSEITEAKKEIGFLEEELVQLRLDAEKHTSKTLTLSTRVEELQHKEKLHESELESETKQTRDEIVAYKKSCVGKEVKLKELERVHEELSKLVISREAEVATIANQLRAAHSGSQRASQVHTRSDKSDRRLIENLLAEKTQLKTEMDRLSRETGRLQVIIKDLQENTASREPTIQTLLTRFSELEMIDKGQASNILHSEDKIARGESMQRAGDADLRSLMERVIIQNIYLKKSIPQLGGRLS